MSVNFRNFLKFISKIKYQILGLVIYVFAESKLTLINGGKGRWWQFLYYYSPEIIFFFLNCYILYPLAFKFRKSIFKPLLIIILSLLSQLFIIIGMHALMDKESPDLRTYRGKLIYINETYRVMFTMGITALLWGWINFVALLKREKIYENNLLYSRISPHLFFNSLNFAHSTVLPYSDDAAQMIALMSEFSRHAMAELEEDGKIGLEVEFAQLQLLIGMMKLRFKNLKLDFKLDVGESIANYRIPPQIIVTLAENAFKYGLLEDPQKFVMIAIHESEGFLNVTMSNWKAINQGAVSNKIGLDLINKRLKNIYGKRFNLKIEDNPDFYKIKLMIQL